MNPKGTISNLTYHGGRPKGKKNKFTTLKESFLDSFKNIGGTEKLTEWARKPKNMRDFLTLIARMLPNKVEADVKIEPLIIIRSAQSEEVIPVPEKESKDEVKDTPAVSG